MTRDTSIAIGRPTDVRELFKDCRTLLGCRDDVPTREGDGYRTGCKEIANPMGIGLPALLEIQYGADGPMIHRCDSFCDSGCTDVQGDDPRDNGWAAIEVSFDTSYGYRGPDGEGCSDLHARLVRAVGQWCEQRGLPWKWQNEFTGEWFNGMDGLDQFGNAFQSTGAESCFTDVVMPAIRGRAQ